MSAELSHHAEQMLIHLCVLVEILESGYFEIEIFPDLLVVFPVLYYLFSVILNNMLETFLPA